VAEPNAAKMADAQPVEVGEHGPSSGIKDRALHAAEHFTEKRRERQLERLRASRQAVTNKLREVPDRMQKLVNQMRLLLDLVDDYASGRYRGVRWYSLGVAVLAVLYFLSPGDVIPDWFPVVGQFDDVAAVAIALRLVKRDLVRYVRFRGLDRSDYF
jgi:uncharacterized membrane protein YkvA (DUF1232 family)